jgi:hypothetical protein
MDRYQFIKQWVDQSAGGKIYLPGFCVRLGADAKALLDQGIIKPIADFTLCRKNALADNACTPLTVEQAAALETFESSVADEVTIPTPPKSFSRSK